jgi:hypothetical protein
LGWSCAVNTISTYNINYINAMTIGIEKAGFGGDSQGASGQPWPTVDKDLLRNEHKDLDWLACELGR